MMKLTDYLGKLEGIAAKINMPRGSRFIDVALVRPRNVTELKVTAFVDADEKVFYDRIFLVVTTKDNIHKSLKDMPYITKGFDKQTNIQFYVFLDVEATLNEYNKSIKDIAEDLENTTDNLPEATDIENLPEATEMEEELEEIKNEPKNKGKKSNKAK